MKDEFQFLLYKAADESISVDAVIKDETIWLTQKSMAELYGVDKSGISRHLKNIFSEGELEEKVVVAIFATTTSSFNSPVSKILARCLLMPDLSMPNNSAIAFWVTQMLSSLIRALTVTESSSVR